MSEEIKNVQVDEVVNTVDVTPGEDDQASFGVKDCGVVLGIAIAGVAAYEGVRHGIKAIKDHTIPWFKAKFGKNKSEAPEAQGQEPAANTAEETAPDTKADEKSEPKKGDKK